MSFLHSTLKFEITYLVLNNFEYKFAFFCLGSLGILFAYYVRLLSLSSQELFSIFSSCIVKYFLNCSDIAPIQFDVRCILSHLPDYLSLIRDPIMMSTLTWTLCIVIAQFIFIKGKFFQFIHECIIHNNNPSLRTQ